MEFLFVSDNHFGRLQSYLPKSMDWESISLKPLIQAEKYAIDNGIEHIVHGGDLYDFLPTQEMQVIISRFFAKSKVNWWCVNGNHAYKSPKEHGFTKLIQESNDGWLPNVKFINNPTALKIDNIPFIFLPWPYTKHKLLKHKRSIVIAHTERAGFRMDNGRAISGKPFSLKGHYWMVGHLHSFQEKEDIIFSGATAQLRNGDPKEHFFLHVTVDEKIKPKIKKVLINPGYEFIDIRVENAEEIPDLSKLKDGQLVRLLNHVNVHIPTEILSDERVIDHQPYGSKADLESIRKESINLDAAYEGVSLESRFDLIMDFLKKGNLDKKKIKAAKKLLRKEVEEIKFEQTGLR